MSKKVLVIGSGGAGLTSAITAKENGCDVFVVTKEYPTRSQTCMAQGGINAAIDPNDSIQNHINDTIKGSKNLADKKAVEILCQNAPKAIEWLNSIGVVFSRTADGKIAQRKLGAASFDRACYAKDYTGLKILHTLYDYANKLDIKFLNEKFLLDLMVKDGICFGAVFLDIRSGELEAIKADVTILATGGYSKIYGKHSTNSKAATGDGLAVALKNNAELSNMEFVQFHPTGLKNSSILISESARGLGAKILNSKNERFVDELKPRDEISQAMFDEIRKGEDIYLDLRHIEDETVKKELPQEVKLAKIYENVDITKEKLPIKPVAHYTMGGVKTYTQTKTSIKNLLATGEVSQSGIHGANRLGGNSLAEIVVFGKIAGEVASTLDTNSDIDESVFIKDQQDKITDRLNLKGDKNFYKISNKLSDMMYKKCGIKRNEKELNEVLKFLNSIDFESFGIKEKSKTYNTELVDFLEFENKVTVAKEVVLSAIKNKNSLGAHFREDV